MIISPMLLNLVYRNLKSACEFSVNSSFKKNENNLKKRDTKAVCGQKENRQQTQEKRQKPQVTYPKAGTVMRVQNKEINIKKNPIKLKLVKCG